MFYATTPNCTFKLKTVAPQNFCAQFEFKLTFLSEFSVDQ